MCSLGDMQEGSSGSLVTIGGERSFRRRLMEMGLLPGTRVRLVRRVGPSGLIELEVRGCHMSLRRSEAHQLQLMTD